MYKLKCVFLNNFMFSNLLQNPILSGIFFKLLQHEIPISCNDDKLPRFSGNSVILEQSLNLIVSNFGKLHILSGKFSNNSQLFIIN